MRNKVSKQLRKLAKENSGGYQEKNLNREYKREYKTREFLNKPVLPPLPPMQSVIDQLKQKPQ